MMSAAPSPHQNREITLTADEADELLVTLNDIVVSLDRMGSRWGSGEDPEHTWIYEYFTSGGATLRVSHARRLLLEAFNRVYTEDEQVALWDEHPWPAWGRGPADDR